MNHHMTNRAILIHLALILPLLCVAQNDRGGPDRDIITTEQRSKPKVKKPLPIPKDNDCVADTTRKRTSKELADDTKRFLFFTIPTLLNGSNMDPSPVSNASVDLTTEELRLKLGIPGTFRVKNEWKKDQFWTASISPFASAGKEKKASLLNRGSWAANYGVDVGINIVPPHRTWVACQAGVDDYAAWTAKRDERGVHPDNLDTIQRGQRISEAVWWLAFRGTLESKEFTMFQPGSAFADLVSTRTLGLGRGYIAGNFFFHSALRRKRWFNWMASGGIGQGSFTNYSALAERTLHEGTIVYNKDSTARMVAETKNGRIGPLKVTTGLLAFVEAYKTVAFLGFGGEIRVGGRLDLMGIGTEDHNSRLAPGIFINAKKPGKGGDPPADVVNVALIFQMDQFQMKKDKEYWETNAALSISAAFPLRFK